jgi:hypothetical protein
MRASREDGVCLLAGAAHDTTTFALQLRSYGNAEVLTQRLLGRLRAWDAAGRPRGERLEIVVSPLDAEVDIPNDAVVMSKRWHQFMLRWR